jgi:indole-3-glycerol phosphate synthase
MSADFLGQMAHASRERLAQARRAEPEAALRARALATPAPPPLRLSTEGFDLIAEVKLRSPASGVLRPAAQPPAQLRERVHAYAAAGAAAISVITEPSRFDGALEHLAQAAHALGAPRAAPPVMRKDFLVDPYQIYEARAAGAGGALVILRMLSGEAQRALIEACADSQLFALLEAFDEADLARAGELVQQYRGRARLLVGVNCRDLGTLQVVPGRLETLAPRLPPDVPHVAESGVENGADAARLARAGYDVALVGSALMRAGEPGALAREILTCARAARVSRSAVAAREL